ncbi:unnamed protein product [Lymnaea stagnalis]|uniref:Titin-like n=1 Tax=Lymnaea stagnalis TaxID=6523 RepID=A0AAV2I8M8_LYMST
MGPSEKIEEEIVRHEEAEHPTITAEEIQVDETVIEREVEGIHEIPLYQEETITEERSQIYKEELIIEKQKEKLTPEVQEAIEVVKEEILEITPSENVEEEIVSRDKDKLMVTLDEVRVKEMEQEEDVEGPREIDVYPEETVIEERAQMFREDLVIGKKKEGMAPEDQELTEEVLLEELQINPSEKIEVEIVPDESGVKASVYADEIQVDITKEEKEEDDIKDLDVHIEETVTEERTQMFREELVIENEKEEMAPEDREVGVEVQLQEFESTPSEMLKEEGVPFEETVKPSVNADEMQVDETTIEKTVEITNEIPLYPEETITEERSQIFREEFIIKKEEEKQAPEDIEVADEVQEEILEITPSDKVEEIVLEKDTEKPLVDAYELHVDLTEQEEDVEGSREIDAYQEETVIEERIHMFREKLVIEKEKEEMAPEDQEVTEEVHLEEFEIAPSEKIEVDIVLQEGSEKPSVTADVMKVDEIVIEKDVEVTNEIPLHPEETITEERSQIYREKLIIEKEEEKQAPEAQVDAQEVQLEVFDITPSEILKEEITVSQPEVEEVEEEITVSQPDIEEFKVEISVPQPEIEEIEEEILVSKPEEEEVVEEITVSQPEVEEVEEEITVSQPEVEEFKSEISISLPEVEAMTEEKTVSQPQVEEVEEEITVSQPKVEEVEEEITVSQPKVEEVEEEITVSQPEVEEVKEEITVSQPEVEEFKAEISVSQPEVEEVEEKITLSQPEVEEVEEETTVSQPEVEEVEEEFTVSEPEVEEFKAEISVSQPEVEEVEEEIIVSQPEVGEFDEEVAVSQPEVEEVEEEITVSQPEVEERLRKKLPFLNLK